MDTIVAQYSRHSGADEEDDGYDFFGGGGSGGASLPLTVEEKMDLAPLAAPAAPLSMQFALPPVAQVRRKTFLLLPPPLPAILHPSSLLLLFSLSLSYYASSLLHFFLMSSAFQPFKQEDEDNGKNA